MTEPVNHKTLSDLYLNHHGMITDKWTFYIKAYEDIFQHYRSLPVRLLEIGVQNGGSLAIWAQYFGAATDIVGCDINPACGGLRYDDPRIHVIVGDANADATEALIEAVSPIFDLIIDDGSHRSGDIVRSFARYFPRLAHDGLFVAEDLHCAYWAEYEGGLFDPWSSMAFFKRLADILNHEHWGIPKARADILRPFRERYGIALSESLLAEIHSVEFLNSICVIRKRPSADNVLGPRVVEGEEATAETLVAGSGSLSSPADQGTNPWSAMPPLPEEELLALRAVERLSHEQAATIAEQAGTIGEQARILDEQARIVDEQSRIISQQAGIADEQTSTIEGLRRALAVKSGQLQIAQEFSRNLDANAAAAHARADRSDGAGAALRSRISELENQAAALAMDAASSRALLDHVWRSTSWRVSAPVRWVGQQLKRGKRTARLASALSARPGGVPRLMRGSMYVVRHRGLGALRSTLRALESETFFPAPPPSPQEAALPALPGEDPFEAIAREIFAEQQAELSREAAAQAIAGFAHQPLISVLMPVYKTPVQWLRRAVEFSAGTVLRRGGNSARWTIARRATTSGRCCGSWKRPIRGCGWW